MLIERDAAWRLMKRGRHKADKQKPLSGNHVTVSLVSEKEGRSLPIMYVSSIAKKQRSQDQKCLQLFVWVRRPASEDSMARASQSPQNSSGRDHPPPCV